MRTLIIAALFLTSATCALFAQSNTDEANSANFRGQVRYSNNAPAAFVPVELWTDGETTWRTIVNTDRMGKFQTTAPCMVIQFKVNDTGYRPIYGRTDISTKPCRAFESLTLLSSENREKTAPGTVDARIAAIPDEARLEYNAGQAAIGTNSYADAIPHLEKAISLYPRYAEAYQLMAVAQMQLNQAPQAESSLLKAIGIEEKLPNAQYLLGVLYGRTGRPALAQKPLGRFADLAPENPDAPFELAKASFALQRFSDAETHARKAIKLKEPDPGVHIVLAYALLRQSKPNEARKEFQTFLAQAPASPMAPDVKNTLALLDQHARN